LTNFFFHWSDRATYGTHPSFSVERNPANTPQGM
jgi:hypothetical protein